MKKTPAAGEMAFNIEEKVIYCSDKPFFTDSPKLIIGAKRITHRLKLSIETYEAWEKNEFILKDMESGEKIISKKKNPIVFDTSKPICKSTKIIGTTCKKTPVDKGILLPTGKTLQGRMKLSNGIFDNVELPEDKTRVVLEEPKVIGEIPKAKVELSLRRDTAISSKIVWNIEIFPPKDSELVQATLDIYQYNPKQPAHVLNCDQDLKYTEEFLDLPKKGGRILYKSNENTEQFRIFAALNVKAFLSVRNKDGVTATYTADIPVTPVHM